MMHAHEIVQGLNAVYSIGLITAWISIVALAAAILEDMCHD